MRLCRASGCSTYASFGLISDGIVIFCSAHKTPEMIDLASQKKRCKHTGCLTLASFGLELDGILTYCSKHKTPDMIDLKHQKERCKHAGCLTLASFGLELDGILTYCSKHKTPDMIDLANRKQRCKHTGCLTQASFGLASDGIRVFCSKHKTPEMIDLVHQKERCKHTGCLTRASFGLELDGILAYCSKHKTPEMIDLANRKQRCKHTGCLTQASFGLASDGIRVFCSKHKTPEMIDLKNQKRRCRAEGCLTQASFGLELDGILAYCSKHKTPEMINLKDQKKTCKHAGCLTRSTYGWLGYNPSSCAKHKESGMIRFPKKTCDECTDKATHKGEGESYYCDAHVYGKAGLVDFMHRCSVCVGAIEPGAERSMCEACSNMVDLAGKPKPLRKEVEVRNWITEAGYILTADKPIDETGACSRYRPDILIRTWYGAIIVEVDERQHSAGQYKCSCEISRMSQLYHDLGVMHGTIAIVRYNPDKYKGLDHDMLTVSQRKAYLLSVIDFYYKGMPPKPGVFVEWVSYDGFTRTDRCIDYIDPYDPFVGLQLSRFWGESA